jgi:hypothetical protein
MGTATIETLLPLVQLPRCPDNAVLQALRLAAREFCLDTGCWREAIDAVAMVAGQTEYALVPEYGNATIRHVVSVEIDGATVPESRWSFQTDGVLVFDPEWVGGTSLVATVVYLPSVSCDDLPDWLLVRFGESISSRAVAGLKLNPESSRDPVPWYDPSGAVLALERYRQGVFEAKVELLTGRRSGDVRVQHSSFYL